MATGRVWDISRELDTTSAIAIAHSFCLFRASAAIPGIFPPVIIDGRPQSDGGSIGNVLQPIDLATCKALVERLRAHNVTTPVTLRMWVLLNVWTHAPLAVIDPSSRTSYSLARGRVPVVLAGTESGRIARPALACGDDRGAWASCGGALHGGAGRDLARSGRAEAVRPGVHAPARGARLRASARRKPMGLASVQLLQARRGALASHRLDLESAALLLRLT